MNVINHAYSRSIQTDLIYIIYGHLLHS